MSAPENIVWLCPKCRTELEGNQATFVGWYECPKCGESFRYAELETHAIKKVVNLNSILCQTE